jgi:hypothetical protein
MVQPSISTVTQANGAHPPAWLSQSALLFQGLSMGASDESPWMLQSTAAKVKVPVSDAQGLDATMVRLAFDQRNLYVAARVADSALVRAPEAAPPQTGDAIALGIDVRSLTGSGANAMGGGFTDEWGQINVRGTYGLVIAVPSADGATRKAILPPYLSIEGAQVAARRIEGGYEIEASLPLQSLKDESGQVTHASRLRSSIGVQLHVFDRDKAMPEMAPDALPPAPSYTWRRDSTRPNRAERNSAGIAWGIAQVTGTLEGMEKETGDKVQFSNPQLENGRVRWRILSWQPQGAQSQGEKQPPFSFVHKGSAFDIFYTGQVPTTISSPLYERSVGATQPEFEVGAPQTRDIPTWALKYRGATLKLKSSQAELRCWKPKAVLARRNEHIWFPIGEWKNSQPHSLKMCLRLRRSMNG